MITIQADVSHAKAYLERAKTLLQSSNLANVLEQQSHYNFVNKIQNKITDLGIYDTGALKQSIGTKAVIEGRKIIVKVFAGVSYAIYHEKGTGLFGPKQRLITAKRKGGFMQFTTKDGKIIRTPTVRGIRPRPYFVPTVIANLYLFIVGVTQAIRGLIK